MNQYTGFTAETAKRLLVDAGAFYKNLLTTEFNSLPDAKLIGATRGGGVFNAIPELRPIEVDGVKGRAKGLTNLDSWDINMTANVLEMTVETLKLALATTTVDTTTDTDYDIIKANNDIAESDYVDNITYVGKLSGSEKPVIIQMFNVLNSNGLSITREDKNESVVTMELHGHYAAEDLESPPFAIYYPKAPVVTP